MNSVLVRSRASRVASAILHPTRFRPSNFPGRRLYSAGSKAGGPAKPPSSTPSQTPGEYRIFDRLKNKFAPSQLQVQDVSGGCGDFYAITITSQSFKGLSTLKQHRMVQEELKDEIASIHGLQLKTSSG